MVTNSKKEASLKLVVANVGAKERENKQSYLNQIS
jgi:hypothetical protein